MTLRSCVRSLAALALVAGLASSAEANYTLALSGLNPAPGSNNNGLTTLDFTLPAASQASIGSFAQPFNILNVGEPTGSANGSGTYSVTENFTLTGDTTNPGSLSGTFNLLFTIGTSPLGATSSLTSFTVTNLVGSGFSFLTPPSYTQPTAGTSAATGTAGNVSLVIIPTAAVPEPASMVMLGLGLVGAGGYGLRRRTAK